MQCTPNELLANARAACCLAVLGQSYLRQVQISLLCAWLKAVQAAKGGGQ